MTKEQILQELEFCIEGYSDFRDGKIGIGCFSNYVSALACVKREIEIGLVEREGERVIKDCKFLNCPINNGNGECVSTNTKKCNEIQECFKGVRI